jgi:hypothetical protein
MAGGSVDKGRQTARKDMGRTMRANIPVTESKAPGPAMAGTLGEGLQEPHDMGMSAPKPGPGGGTVKSEGRGS